MIILAGSVFSFCTYTPDEDFFKKIEPVDPAGFTISLADYTEGDTIYLEGPATFTYSLGSGNGHIEDVRIYLGEALIEAHNRTSETSGSFTASPSTGVFPLRIEFISTSGTGSLIDQAGGELVQVWSEWIIKAYVETPPEKPVITSSIVDGYAVISWTPYTKTKFVHYQFQVENGPTLIITDPLITSWVDSTYTGNFTRTYWIETKNLIGSEYNAITLSGNGNLTMQASFTLADSSILVTVPKPVYYGTFTSYSIIENDVQVGQITDPNQTTFTFNTSSVGVNYTTHIEVKSNVKAPASEFAYSSKTLNTAVPLQKLSQAIQRFTYNTDLNSIIGFNATGSNNDTGELFTINPATFAINASFPIFNGPGYHVPYSGEYAYYSRPKQLIQLNLLTHEEKAFDAIGSTFGSGPSVISGSQPQLVGYTWFGPGSGSTPIYYYSRIYNMATNQVLTETLRNTLTSYTISDDGNFARLGDYEFYTVSAGTLSLIGNLSVAGLWVGFRPDKCDEILSRTGNALYVYDANTLTLKHIVSAPGGGGFVTYDVATKNVIFNNDITDKLYCVGIDTGIVKEFNVNANGIAFINGAVFLDSQTYLRLY